MLSFFKLTRKCKQFTVVVRLWAAWNKNVDIITCDTCLAATLVLDRCHRVHVYDTDSLVTDSRFMADTGLSLAGLLHMPRIPMHTKGLSEDMKL